MVLVRYAGTPPHSARAAARGSPPNAPPASPSWRQARHRLDGGVWLCRHLAGALPGLPDQRRHLRLWLHEGVALRRLAIAAHEHALVGDRSDLARTWQHVPADRLPLLARL